MSEMAEDFEVLQRLKKERHQKWFDQNIKTLANSGMPYTFKETVCLFRINGKPKVDFYPHTGRWKSNNKMYSGGAKSFLNWYNKQSKDSK